MYIIYENVLYCHTYSLPSCIHGHNTLHRAALFAAVADHAGDAHSGVRQADHASLDGGIAEQENRLLLVVRDDFAAVFRQQIAGVGGLGTFQSCLAKGVVQLERLAA